MIFLYTYHKPNAPLSQNWLFSRDLPFFSGGQTMALKSRAACVFVVIGFGLVMSVIGIVREPESAAQQSWKPTITGPDKEAYGIVVKEINIGVGFPNPRPNVDFEYKNLPSKVKIEVPPDATIIAVWSWYSSNLWLAPSLTPVKDSPHEFTLGMGGTRMNGGTVPVWLYAFYTNSTKVSRDQKTDFMDSLNKSMQEHMPKQLSNDLKASIYFDLKKDLERELRNEVAKKVKQDLLQDKDFRKQLLEELKKGN
jgi:hypothetical protein